MGTAGRNRLTAIHLRQKLSIQISVASLLYFYNAERCPPARTVSLALSLFFFSLGYSIAKRSVGNVKAHDEDVLENIF